MNTSMIRYILGNILKLQSAFLLLPAVADLIYKENAFIPYITVAVSCFIIGLILTWKKPVDTVFYLKEGCVATSLSWIVLSISGAFPFMLTGEIPHFIDALFETVSGFTTTASSVLSDVEVLSHSSIIWLSFTHWIGGMGILVFLLAVIPMSGGSNINLMKAESPGPTVGKLVPKMRSSARILYFIYLGMSGIMLIILLLGNMPLFDALATTFGTAGTGGFGFKNDSFASFSPYIQWTTAIFMMLFGVNFQAYYLILFRDIKKAFKLEEIRWYLVIVALSTFIIFTDLMQFYPSLSDALRDSFFQVSSIITTTGFVTTDYNQWSITSRSVLVLLMFLGACAGSTSGGLKVSRLIILFKTIMKELTSYTHPKSIVKIKMDGKPIEHEVVRSANVYFITYAIIFVVSFFCLTFENKDLVTTFTAVAATINNIGTGLEMVGPASNFGHFSDFSKLVLIFDMLAGRLELFPLLMLFHPEIWKDTLTRKLR